MKNLRRKRVSTPFRPKKKQKISQANAGTISRPLANITPQGVVVTVNYVTPVQLSDSSLGFANYYFRAASIFDPDLSGVGHQPLGHDQLETMYQRYRVLSAKITVEAVNSLATSSPCTLYVAPRTTTVGVGPDSIQEATGTKYCVLSGAENRVGKLSVYMNIDKMEGDPGAKYDKDYTASFGSNPTRDVYFIVGCNNIAGGSQVAVAANVKIEYTVRCYDRIDLLQS